MGRIRSIRPELRENADFASLTDAAARLFLMLYTLADDKGRCPAGARYLAGAVFFGRPRAPAVVGRLLAELSNAGFIELYTVTGSPYLLVRGWDDQSSPTHQRIEKRQTPKFPAPPSSDSGNLFPDGSVTDPDRERIGRGSGGEEPAEPARPAGTPPPPEPLSPEIQSPAISQPPAKIADAPKYQRGLGAWGMAELNRIRERVAVRFGWTDVRPLHPQDHGERDLRERLLESGDRGEENLKHVLAIAEAEAIAKQTVEYLTGRVFHEESWRKKLGMRIADARRAPPRPGGPGVVDERGLMRPKLPWAVDS